MIPVPVLLCTAPSSRMVPADGRASISHRKHRVCAAKTAHTIVLTCRNLIPLPNHKISLWIFVFLCIVPSPGINVYLFYLLTYNYEYLPRATKIASLRNTDREHFRALWRVYAGVYLFDVPGVANPLPTLLTVLVLQVFNGSPAKF